MSLERDKEPWTDGDVLRFAELCAADKAERPGKLPDFEAMSPRLGRSAGARLTAYSVYGISRGATARKCPRCSRQFFSAHSGQRMCKRCRMRCS
jgi:ribosomal protein S27AE